LLSARIATVATDASIDRRGTAFSVPNKLSTMVQA
jgi:hypothetical protein